MGCAAVMGEFDNAALAVRLREEIARQNLSRARLADAARLSLSTLEKGLTGRRRFTLETIVRLEQALGASLREAAPAAGLSGEVIFEKRAWNEKYSILCLRRARA